MYYIDPYLPICLSINQCQHVYIILLKFSLTLFISQCPFHRSSSLILLSIYLFIFFLSYTRFRELNRGPEVPGTSLPEKLSDSLKTVDHFQAIGMPPARAVPPPPYEPSFCIYHSLRESPKMLLHFVLDERMSWKAIVWKTLFGVTWQNSFWNKVTGY